MSSKKLFIKDFGILRKTQDSESDGTATEKLETEEGMKKAQSLFSKQFMDYLSSKKLNMSSKMSDHRRSYNTPILHHRDHTSSDETTASDSSKHSYKKIKRKVKDKKRYSVIDFNNEHRSKITQCNLIKEGEKVVISEELKTFLVNMTILLQELKKTSSEPVEYMKIYTLISKITILLTEFGRRPLKIIEQDKKGEHYTNLEKNLEAILSLVSKYKKGAVTELDMGIRECKRLEKEIISTNQKIKEKTNEISEEELKGVPKTSDINLQVKNSILTNEILKAKISFNKAHIKKYKKMVVEKEWTKHKLQNEMNNLMKKAGKSEAFDPDNLDIGFLSSEQILKNESENLQKKTVSKVKTPRLKKKVKNVKIEKVA